MSLPLIGVVWAKHNSYLETTDFEQRATGIKALGTLICNGITQIGLDFYTTIYRHTSASPEIEGDRQRDDPYTHPHLLINIQLLNFYRRLLIKISADLLRCGYASVVVEGVVEQEGADGLPALVVLQLQQFWEVLQLQYHQ